MSNTYGMYILRFMDDELRSRIEHMEHVLELTRVSVEKTRKYILIMVISSVVAFVLPLLGLLIVVPIVMNTLSSAYSGLL